MKSLEYAFPDQASAIDSLRAADPELDEICRDFEVLSRDIAALEVRTDAAARSLHSDIRESLVGLTDEIRARIATYTDITNNTKD